MQQCETAELIWKPGTANDHCSSDQPRRSHLHELFAGALDGSLEVARPRLLRLAHLSGIGPDEAEDVVQETYLEAWRSLPKLREPERLSAWLDGICRNICKRHLRLQATRTQAGIWPTSLDEGDTSAFDLPDPLAIDPAEELEHQDMQVLLDRALGYLPASTRELIELCYLAEVPQHEIAERLDMSLGALEVKLHRARRRLHQVLHGQLRDDAQAFGLLRDGDEAMGWQEMRYWCWTCGKRRVRATFEQQPSGIRVFRLRCPNCSPKYHIDLTPTGQWPPLVPIHSAMHSFRPALKHMLLACAGVSDTIFTVRHCPMCQSSVQIDLLDRNAPEHERLATASLPQSIYFRVACPTCGPYEVECISVLLRLKSVLTFFLERSRVLIPPSIMDTYAGQDAIRSRLLDLTSGERLTIMTHPHTFQVMTTIVEK
ncbi:MAG: sigma-70 family RNA polymerase sigma factor [Ktedonobacteraceae bacterium]|nr:sigma-70 family RNA polymerase sigma factor [Ktedonobacteraceae bacterium]